MASLRLMVSQITRGADPGAVYTFGTAEADVGAFVPRALSDADVVICDQNLEYGRTTYLGTAPHKVQQSPKTEV